MQIAEEGKSLHYFPLLADCPLFLPVIIGFKPQEAAQI